MRRGLLRAAAAIMLLNLVTATAVARATGKSAKDQALLDAAKAVMVTDPVRSLALARRLEQETTEPMIRATAQWLEGEALSRAGDAGAASAALKRALSAVLRLAPGDALQGEILLSQGWTAEDAGNIATAFNDFQQAYWILRRTVEQRGEGKALQAIAGIYQVAGDNARALRYYAQAIDVYHDDPVFVIAAHNNVGESLRLLGHYGEAQPHYLAALALATRQGSRRLQVDILTNLAWARLLDGDPNGAGTDARRALALAQRPDLRDELPAVQGVLASIAAKQNDYATAVSLMDRAFAGVDLQTTALPFLPLHQAAADIYAHVGRTDLAYRHLLAFKRLDDGRRALAASTNSALMAAQFDFSNQNLKITQLQANRARLHELILVLVLVAVAVLSALMGFGLVSLRRSRNRERAANAELSIANGSLEKALHAKSEFLAVTSHEIRTPLNGILGMTQVLLADRTIPGPLKCKMQVIHGAGETMRSLVDDILDLSKIDAGKLTVTPTRVALKEMLEGLAFLWRAKAEAKQLTLTLDVANCPAVIEEDGDRLRQVLMNLLGNAVKFTEAGTVTLSASVADRGGGEELVLAVADTGIGIAEEQQAHVFEKFVQADASTSRRYGGTGLGLAISRAVADALGARLELCSIPSKGSTFSLALPLRRAAVEMPIDGRAADLPEGRTLLLVEPNLLNRRLLAKALSAQGVHIAMAETGHAALAALASQRFHHVVVQAALPEEDRVAMLGRLVTAAKTGGATILTLVGPDDQVCADELSGAMVLCKPVSPGRIVEALGIHV